MHILVICTGNICRSQLAVGYLKWLIERNCSPGNVVESAGIAGFHKLSIPQAVFEVAGHSGFQIMESNGKQVNRAMLERADIILVMEYAHASFLLDLDPTSLTRIKITGSYDPGKALNKEVKDPGKFDFTSCLATFQELKSCLDSFYAKEILEDKNPAGPDRDMKNEEHKKDAIKEENSRFFEFHFDD